MDTLTVVARHRRVILGYTVRRLAQDSRLSVSTVVRFLSGREVSWGSMDAILRALQLRVVVLPTNVAIDSLSIDETARYGVSYVPSVEWFDARGEGGPDLR